MSTQAVQLPAAGQDPVNYQVISFEPLTVAKWKSVALSEFSQDNRSIAGAIEIINILIEDGGEGGDESLSENDYMYIIMSSPEFKDEQYVMIHGFPGDNPHGLIYN